MTIQKCMTNFGDYHPNVQCFMKTLQDKQLHGVQNTSNDPASYATAAFFNLYILCSFMTAELKVVDINRDLLHGISEIVNVRGRLPPELSIQSINGPITHILYADGASFFSDSVYKSVQILI